MDELHDGNEEYFPSSSSSQDGHGDDGRSVKSRSRAEAVQEDDRLSEGVGYYENESPNESDDDEDVEDGGPDFDEDDKDSTNIYIMNISQE